MADQMLQLAGYSILVPGIWNTHGLEAESHSLSGSIHGLVVGIMVMPTAGAQGLVDFLETESTTLWTSNQGSPWRSSTRQILLGRKEGLRGWLPGGKEFAVRESFGTCCYGDALGFWITIPPGADATPMDDVRQLLSAMVTAAIVRKTTEVGSPPPEYI
jgi:hypothetical protein